MAALEHSARDLEREVAELQRRLAEREAELAESQRRLAERESGLAEAVAQQAASSEVLQVINSSPGDLAPVFDAMLEKAMRLCEADFGIMFTVESESARIVATRDIPAALSDFLQEHPPLIGLNTFFGRAVLGRAVLHTADIREEEQYGTGQPLTRTASDIAGVRALLMAPLVKEDAVVGVFAIFRREVRLFTDKQIGLLENFAAQAVIAMENARLITETREALEQQTATAEVLGVINSSPGELAPVFDTILEKAHALCSAATGSLQLYDGEFVRAVATRGLPDEFANLLRQPRRTSVSLRSRDAFSRGEPFVQFNDLEDPGLTEVDKTLVAARDIAGVRTLLHVPLRKDEALLGLIVAGRREVRPFSQQEISLLQSFAAQAVIAMENARLITETREALEQQTATAEVLGVINSSPGDLAPVFDAMLEKATRLCEAPFGLMSTYDGQRFHQAASYNVPASLAAFYASDPVQPGPETGLGRIVRGAELVHIIDLADSSEIGAGDPRRQRLVELGGVRSYVVAALRKDGKLLGTIAAYREEVRPFTDKQIALLQNFAAQAVIAMENARLLGELRQRTDEVAELNRGLEARVAEQVEELGRVGRLKRFLAPQLAELIVSQGDEKILESHRREIVVVFCDLRGYTAFTETAEPEEVLDFLREYHGALGPLVSQFEGTLDQFSGDGIMVFFNDPVPIPGPAERAVKMAIAMREAAGALIATWRRRDRELGFGAGIAQGYATLGQIGFADRSGYTAIGTVCNLAARLCAEAKDGQILVSGRVAAAVEKIAALDNLGSLALKGITQPVSVFNVLENRAAGASAEIVSLRRDREAQ